VQEPLHIYCCGTQQFTGGQSWLHGRGFDWWSPRLLVPQACGDESWWGEDQYSPLLTDPTEWLRVEAAVVLGTLRPAPALRMMKMNVEFALLWVDVADRPDVLDLGRVLASEGVGEASCSWSRVGGRGGESVCLLTVALRRPVRAAFAIPFSFPDTQRILTGILRARSLVLCFGAPPPEMEPMVDARTLYELATTPSRETITMKFDWAAHQDLQNKMLQWASGEA
jgi:hypothetical protein